VPTPWKKRTGTEIREVGWTCLLQYALSKGGETVCALQDDVKARASAHEKGGKKEGKGGEKKRKRCRQQGKASSHSI